MTQLNYINKPVFDHGAIEQISEILGGMGIKKPLICTDPGLVQLGMLDQLRNLISNHFPEIYKRKWKILLGPVVRPYWLESHRRWIW